MDNKTLEALKASYQDIEAKRWSIDEEGNKMLEFFIDDQWTPLVKFKQ